MAVWRGRTAANRFTGMLTSPKVMVPDQLGRTGAGASSAAGRVRLRRSGNFLLPSRSDAGFEAGEQARLRRLFLTLSGRRFFATRLGLDQVAQSFPILVVPLPRIEIPRNGVDQLSCELELM